MDKQEIDTIDIASCTINAITLDDDAIINKLFINDFSYCDLDYVHIKELYLDNNIFSLKPDYNIDTIIITNQRGTRLNIYKDLDTELEIKNCANLEVYMPDNHFVLSYLKFDQLIDTLILNFTDIPDFIKLIGFSSIAKKVKIIFKDYLMLLDSTLEELLEEFDLINNQKIKKIGTESIQISIKNHPYQRAKKVDDIKGIMDRYKDAITNLFVKDANVVISYLSS
jgi:hypothetical protein